jgi:two-component system invasion response regulator UvrY
MKILVVDDHAIVRAGLRRLLVPEIAESVVEAASSREAVKLFKEHRPALVILDLNLPGAGGLETLRRFRAEAPSVPVLVFSMHADAIFARRALEAGAAGYVTKNAPPDEIGTAVRTLASGGRHVEAAIDHQVDRLGNAAAGDPLRALSRRDLEILRQLGDGKSLMQIADALGLSYKTVANTCGQMKTKLGVARSAELIRLAVETGLVGSAAPGAAVDAV